MEELNPDKVQALPFSTRKQDAILGHLVKNDKFFKYARDKILPHWFVDPFNGKIYQAKLNYMKETARPPSIDELKESRDFAQETQAYRTKMTTKMALAAQESEIFKLDGLTPELTSWLKCRIYHESVEASVKRFNAERYDQAVEILNKAVKEYVEVSFDGSNEVDLTDLSFLKTSIYDRTHALTFGLKKFDEKLLPGNENGGSLLPGDSTVLIGPNNVGKTTVMITVIRHNLYNRKSILYIPIEGRLADLQEKLWCSVLDVNKVELLRKYETAEGLEQLNRWAKMIKENLVIVPQLKAGLMVEDIAQIIRKKQQEREALDGKGFDLVVIDYPAKLSTKQAEGGHMQRRHIDAYVYNYFVQLALELNYHSLVAIQVNREGSKINKGLKGAEERLLLAEDVMEAWEATCTATNIVTINRSPTMASRHVVTFYICKNRSSETGWAIAPKSNYANCITHSNYQDAVAYLGTAAMPDRIGDLLCQWKGQDIPPQALLKPTG